MTKREFDSLTKQRDRGLRGNQWYRRIRLRVNHGSDYLARRAAWLAHNPGKHALGRGSVGRVLAEHRRRRGLPMLGGTA
jgi:hypothetical protein